MQFVAGFAGLKPATQILWGAVLRDRHEAKPSWTHSNQP